MKKIILSISIPLAIAATLFTCRQQEVEKKPKEASFADEGAVAVSLVPVKQVTMAMPITASGLVSTQNESRLSFKIGGIVKKMYVTEGQSVQRGQILATLDLTEIEAQVNQARNQVDKWRRDLDRVQRLFKDSAATLEMVQNIQTAYDVALESKNVAEFNKEYAIIKASSSGKILKKFLNEGELAGPGIPVFYMNSAGQNEWIIKLSLPDVDWARVKIGDACNIKLDVANEAVKGNVSLVGEGADPFTGLYPIEVKITSQQQRLASGLFATVEITPSKAISLFQIPVETLVEGNGNNAYVFVLNADNKSARRVAVEINSLSGADAYISKGLEGITSVVSSGSGFLTEESTISITKSNL